MRTLSIVLLTLMYTATQAQPGDTTVVQTFTFEAQNDPNSAYDSPGRKWFQFPDDETTYQKILMHYTLKCFSDGTAGGLGFPCGEWDYLTYNFLFQHTGLLDSNAVTHPQFELNNQNFETAEYSTIPLFNTWQYEQTQAAVSSVQNEQEIQLGSDLLQFDQMFSGQGARTQFMLSAAELQATGLTAGTIGKLSLEVLEGNGTATFLTIKLRHNNSVLGNSFDSGNFTTVYHSSTSFDAIGWKEFVFTQPFTWNGTSNLVADISFTNPELPLEVMVAANADGTYGSLHSEASGRYILFDGLDEVEVPFQSVNELSDQVTVSFWLNGTSEFQPEDGTTFEAVNAQNQRVLNSHTPWSNSRVYWDAGEENGYDRIDKAAAAADFEGKWNHWAFTKDATEGEMKVYLNGELWHTGGNRFKTMEDISKFSIGSAAGWSNFYRGGMDDFWVFDSVLTEATIDEWRMKEMTSDHPAFERLQFAYDFNEVNGSPVFDSGSDFQNGLPHGNADRKFWWGHELVKNTVSDSMRPNIKLCKGEYILDLETSVIEVQLPVPPVSLIEFEVSGNQVIPVDYQYVWTDNETHVFAPDGSILSSSPVVNAETITNETLNFFSAPFEVVNRFEIGRFITPYGIQLSLGPDGWSWVYDVTDWAPMLKGMVELEAGNWQELLDMKFIFIEGTPPREVKRIEKVWSGDYQLSSWDNSVGVKTLELQDDEQSVKLSATTSGHWFGQGNNCGEFCNNIHRLKVNGQEEFNWQIIQECADNPLFPQGGTWIYDRAGWCPGATVTQRDFELTPFLNGGEATVEYDITSDPYGNYVFESHAFYYGAMNHQLDAELEQIMAPSAWKIRSRENPICDQPVVRIRNRGALPLTAVTIEFGINGITQTYNWTGNLAFMQAEDVYLNYPETEFYTGDDDEVLLFEVSLIQPNGSPDENPSNNYGTSAFNRPPSYSYPDLDDNRIIVHTTTNLAPWETQVKLLKSNGDLVWQSNYSMASTNYYDTLAVNPGCYMLHITDSGEDGLSFFANSDGNGSTRLRRVGGGTLKNFENDFGKEIKHRFNWATNLISVEEEYRPIASILIFPNPSSGVFNLVLFGSKKINLVRVYDRTGKEVFQRNTASINPKNGFELDLGHCNPGIYHVTVQTDTEFISRSLVITD